MFKKWFRKRKIKKYAKTLPLELRDLYGHRQYYSQEQVDAAVRRRNRGRRQDSSADSICYAYAMYCSPQEFEEIHIRSGEDW